jgi:hypothetical protein
MFEAITSSSLETVTGAGTPVEDCGLPPQNGQNTRFGIDLQPRNLPGIGRFLPSLKAEGESHSDYAECMRQRNAGQPQQP